jgi:hypothetical protein
MIGGSLVTWLAAAVSFGRGIELLLGMAAPLVVAAGTWVAVERTYRLNPPAVTAVMMGGFLGKMLFFGAYVVVVLRGLAVQPEPFVISFTAYFIGLYLVEAIWLKRLFAGARQG